MVYVIYIIIFIFGSIMGSFLNVLAVRLSNNESIIYPRSHCHNCNHKLKWYELIPIISYIIQKGKSRCCHTRIPISYLIVEIVTGALYCTAYHSFGFTNELIISLIFISSFHFVDNLLFETINVNFIYRKFVVALYPFCK